MTLSDLVIALKSRDDALCRAAAAELTNLNKKYQELGRAYDAMSDDLLKLIAENKKLRSAESRRQENTAGKD